MKYCFQVVFMTVMVACDQKIPAPSPVVSSATNPSPIKLTWKQLSGWELPVSLATDILPEEIAAVNAAMPVELKALDGKRVKIAGFMMPCSNKNDLVEMFLVVPDQMACCSGRSPASHEVIAIRPPQAVAYIKDVPIEVIGIFSADTRLTALGSGACNIPWRLSLESIRPAPECAQDLPNPDPNFVPPQR